MPRVKTILVVEDDVAMNTILRDFLGKRGYTVTTVTSATRALILLSSFACHNRPDLVLSDVQLGTISGIDLVKRIVRDYPALPVVLFSVFDQIEKEAIDSGAIKFLKKPFSLETLENVLEEEFNGNATA